MAIAESDREGPSQKTRRLAALDPASVQVDEKSLLDWLIFARRYAGELRYFDDDDRPMGDWSRFLPTELDSEEILAFLEQPEQENVPSSLQRPHFVLFLTFLGLLRTLQAEMNGLTARHLDFYYRDVLRLEARRPIADRVHVAFEPAADIEPFLLPAGTELSAGPDSLDIEQIYLTERDVVISRARIAELRTITVERGNGTESEPEPPAPWQNLYSSTAVATPAEASEIEGQIASWPLFGEPPEQNPGEEPEPRIGWAMASPLLNLGEGRRTIELTMVFDPESFEAGTQTEIWSGEAPHGPRAFRIELSTGEGWRSPDSAASQIEVSATGPSAVARITLAFNEAAPPIQALAGNPELGPMLRVRLRPFWDPELGNWRIPYTELRALHLIAVEIRVEVEQLRSFELENDQGALDGAKPFEPFGPTPTVGSRLAIRHRDWIDKPLESLAFDFEWVDAPDPATHYRNYDLDPPPPFRARIDLVEGFDSHRLGDRVALLPATEIHLPSPPDRPALQSGPSGDGLAAPYVRWQLLAPDFGHSSYPRVAARASLQLSKALAEGGASQLDVDDYQVNPPYTPVLRDLCAGYVASVRIDGTADSQHRLFHVHPFGYSEIESAGRSLLPRYEEDGQLLIGLRDVRAPQSLSLWFQLDESSADPVIEPGILEWSYLSADRWVELDPGNIRHDSTSGLVDSGIIEVELPSTEPSALLISSHGSSGLPPGELSWLRLSLEGRRSGIARGVALHTQAVQAAFDDRANAAEHDDSPLPPFSIKRTAETTPGITAVHQPFSSFGGRAAEPTALFTTRVSERLRHRGRASTAWDIERLVLEHFSEVYKAKCLPAPSDDPGTVQVVVIPDIRHRVPFSPNEPKAATSLLEAIRTFLESKAPSTVTVKVANPRYLHLAVRLAVRFEHSADPELYRRQLENEIQRFLAPWAFDDGVDLEIGSRIYASSLVRAVENLPYVDYVARPRLFLSEDGEHFDAVPPPGSPKEGYSISAGPNEVLVPARQHVIDVILHEDFEEGEATGIGFMVIEFDFSVGTDPIDSRTRPKDFRA